MHIIVIAIGTAGDVHPLLGLSSTFAAHGHRVSFCTSPVFAESVARCGLQFIPAGTVEDYRSAVNDPDMWNPRRSLKRLWTAVAERIRPMYDLLEAEVDNDTIIAAHPWAFAARLLNEKHGVPLVSTQISPSTFFSAKKPPIHKQFTIPTWLPYPIRAGLMWAFDRGVLDRICGPDINRLRGELGLSPVKHVIGRWLHSPQSVLGLFPEWFASPQTDWPANVTLTSFPLFDDGLFVDLDPELEDFLAKGRAPVVLTPGSTVVGGLSYYQAAATALTSLGHRCIFLASQNMQLPEKTPDILVRSYVPLSKLLPHARALVHHGGIGTASHAFAAGIPQLVTPFAHDQFDNAARIENVGCGFQMSAESDRQAILHALKRLLDDVDMQQNCAVIKAKVVPGGDARMKALSVVQDVAALYIPKIHSQSRPTQKQELANM